jgi:hypothetical protein
MLGIFAVVGVLVIGFAVAVASGLVNVTDPFKNLGSNTRPSTQPIAEADPDANQPTESEASLAALKHPGYQDRVIFLSASDAKVTGRAEVEARAGSGYYYTSRRSGSTVDPKNRLPNALIRSWGGPSDSAEWTLNCPQAGKYVITFDCVPGYSSSKGTSGASLGRFTITAGSERLDAAVEADLRGRKGSSSFHLIDVGAIQLPAGQVTLKIQPAEVDRGLLALRSVRIYPAE